ncbi:MAG: hypothetical protein M1546_24640 [Chloroflexi bacterium]|nr:hypothetical protein [Chloroflexota bacterium]
MNTGMNAQVVNREQLMRLVLDLPQSQLQAAYDYLARLEEEVEDAAAVDAAWDEPARPFSEFVEELRRENLYP